MKRRLLIIAIFLQFGAMLNVAAAWSSAALGGKQTRDDPPISRLAAQHIWDRYALEGWPPCNGYDSGSNWWWSGVNAWASTVLAESSVGSPGGDVYVVGQVKVGLPIRTFQYGWYYADGETIRINPVILPAGSCA